MAQAGQYKPEQFRHRRIKERQTEQRGRGVEIFIGPAPLARRPLRPSYDPDQNRSHTSPLVRSYEFAWSISSIEKPWGGLRLRDAHLRISGNAHRDIRRCTTGKNKSSSDGIASASRCSLRIAEFRLTRLELCVILFSSTSISSEAALNRAASFFHAIETTSGKYK